MNRYLYLIGRLKIESKLYSLKNFFSFLHSLSKIHFIILFVISSLFKLFCSFITLVVAGELLRLFQLENLLPYLIFFLLYVFNLEDHQKNETLLKKLFPLFIGAPLSRRQFSVNFLFLPSLVDLILKLDVTLPFMIYLIVTLKIIGVFLIFFILVAVLLRNVWQVEKRLVNKSAQDSSFRVILQRILGSAVGIFVINKLFYLVLFTFESIKKIYQEMPIKQVNVTFTAQLKSLFFDFSTKEWLFVGGLLIACCFFTILNALFQLKIHTNKLYNNDIHCKIELPLDRSKLFSKISFSTVEKVYLLYLEREKTSFHFLISVPEIFVSYYLLYLLCSHVDNVWIAVYMFVAFFIIGNTNIVNAIVIKNQDVFRNYIDISRIYYWKSSKYGIRDLYIYKKNLLVKLALPLVWEQVAISYMIALFIFSRYLVYISLLHFAFILVSTSMTHFSAKLSTFMTPYIFSKNYDLLKNTVKNEAEYDIYNKVYNFYKFPLVLLVILPLLLQLFIELFYWPILVILLGFLGIYFLYIGKEAKLLLNKGEVEYEKLRL